jgi:beta-lactamase regulating signal transducer with metallopeptidase domain/tetratricopeptide (TPR) repeat protein
METLAHTGLAGLVLASKATAILAIGFVVFRALPSRSASARHLAALLALLGAALVPALSPVLPRWEWRVLPPAVAATGRTPESPLARTARVVAAEEPKIFSEGEAGERPREGRGSATRQPGPALPSKNAARSAGPAVPLWRGSDFLAAAVLAWAFGAAAMLTRLVAGLLAVRGLVRRARPLDDPAWTDAANAARRSLGIGRPVALLAGGGTEVPLTAGIFRPVLVLPAAAASWDGDRRRVVLLHELAHVRRRDTLARIAAEVVAALYWFHPLAHAAVAALRRESERAADDLVLAAGTRPSDYAAHLVAIVRGLGREPERWALAMARPSQVEERVRAILDPSLEHRPMGAWQVRLAAATLVASAAVLGAVQVAAARGPDELSSPTVFVQEARTSTSTSTRVQTVSRKTLLAAPRGESGSSWYSRGMKHHENERYDDAIAAFKKAIELGYREDASAYNIACGYALKGDRDHAFEWLKKAASYGFDVESYLTDDDLGSLHSDPRWKDVKKDSRMARKDAHKAEGDRAAARYEKLAAAGGKDGAALYRTGTDALNAGRYDVAEKAFRASAAAGNRVAASTYNAACALARAEKKGEALDTLQKAIEEGYTDGRHMESDDDLENLHGEKRFTELVALADDLSLDAGVEGFMGNFLPHTSRSAWRGEIPRYERVAKAHPTLGIAWYNLGYAQLMADRPEAATASLGKALDLGYRKPTTLYNLACAEARSGNTDKAFERLFAAIDAGFDGADHMKRDTDLDSLRRDARFKKALAQARARQDANADEDSEDED